MCGSIGFEHIGKKIGNIQVTKMGKVPVQFPDGTIRELQWLGFSRKETAISPDAVEVKILAKSYTERGVKFFIPQQEAISAIVTSRSSFPEGIGVFIRTRPATTKELQQCPHDRHPLFVSV